MARPFPAARAVANRWADGVISTLELIGSITLLGGLVIKWLNRALLRRQVRFGFPAAVAQMVRVGVRSISIVMLVSGCIGIILALQTSPSLSDFGQTDKVANLIAVAVFRELGPLVAAIVLTGFAGASIAAEIGTMVVGEEIEALESMALDPVRFLVVPRVLATTFSLVLLAVIGDLTSVIMGGVTGVFFLDIPYELYKSNTINQLELRDFTTGLFKAGVFGTILGLIACHNGLRVTGGAAGVGRATTDTVVQTVVMVVLADLLFSALFYAFGWN